MDLRCKKCGRWLGHTDNDCDLEFKCGNCKTNNQFRVHFMRNPYGENVPACATIKAERSGEAADAEGQIKTADKGNPSSVRS